MINKILQGLFLCLCLVVDVAASNDRAFFWKVESETAVIYMLGSVHFADKSFYPLRNEIEKAFSDSDNLVVELDAESIGPEAYQAQVAKQGSYTGDETIKDHVSAEIYQELDNYLKKMGIPIKAVEKQKPGMIMLTLSALEVMRLGLDPELGIDLHFLRRARDIKKILELETIEDQFSIFMDFPDGELLLKEALYSMEGSREVLDKMITAWKMGDEKKMNRLLFEDAISEFPGFSLIYENLFYSRNRKMANAVQRYLNTKETYFFIVGAGHLIGEKGIVRLLEKAGYKVDRL